MGQNLEHNDLTMKVVIGFVKSRKQSDIADPESYKILKHDALGIACYSERYRP